MHLNNLIGFSLESNKQCVVTGPKDCPKKNNPTEFNPIDWKTSANGQTRTHTHTAIFVNVVLKRQFSASFCMRGFYDRSIFFRKSIHDRTTDGGT